METEFLEQNNKKFGYKRFEYLYLQDNLSEIQESGKQQKLLKSFSRRKNKWLSICTLLSDPLKDRQY
jgi:hypothetical protein